MKASPIVATAIRLVLALSCCLGLPVELRGQFQPASVPRADFPVTDGPVHAILETNGVVFLGGDFSWVMPNESRCVLLDAVNGLPIPSFPAVDGVVHAAIPDGQGGWYLGGRFEFVGGLPRTNLARILAGDSVDTAWNPGANDAVYSLALSAGVLYVGGQFTNLAGQTRRNLAALDALTGSVRPWNPEICCDIAPDQRSRVLALEVSGRRLFVGGAFSRAGNAFRDHLAAFELSTGALVPWPEQTAIEGNFVSALRTAGKTLLVGGRFQTIRGVARSNLAALDVTDGDVLPWNPGTDGDVLALAVRGGTVFAGGNFSLAGNQARDRLAAFDLDTGSPLPWNPAADAPVTRLELSGRTLYAGGDFNFIGGRAQPGLAMLDADSGRSIPVTLPAGRRVRSLAVNGARLLAGSELRHEAQPRARLAALDARTGRLLDWNPGADAPVFALAHAGNRLFAGGDFSRIGNAPRSRLAAINTTTAEVVPWETETTGPNGRVVALAVTGGKVFAAGGFTAVGQIFSPGLASFDLQTGAASGWRPVPNRSVAALDVSGDTIYAAGSFTSVGGQSRRGFAALDAANPVATSWNPNARGNGVNGLAVARSGATVYVGGTFTNIGGQTRRHLAALDEMTGTATSWNPVPGSGADAVQELLVSGGVLYVAGSFSSIGGKNRHAVAALDRATAVALDWNPNPRDPSSTAPVFALAAGESAVYLGGSFTSMSGGPRRHFAAFGPAGQPVFVQQPRGGLVPRGQAVVLTAAATGQQPVAYQWLRDGANIAGATGAELAIAGAQPAHSGTYTVVASNSAGVVASAPALLTVAEPIVVTRPLVNVSVPAGTNLALSLEAAGVPPPRFQWKRNGVPVSGANDPALSFSNAQPADGGIYSVVLFNGLETIETPRVALSVAGPFAANADSFAARTVLSGAAGTAVSHNGAATREPGEPLHAGKNGGRSLWYSWTAPATGIATFDTRGSAFDTLLAVYTNSAVNGTNQIAADDDRGGSLNSQLAFNAVAGREYQIAVDGYASGSGRLVLNWNLETTTDSLPRILLPPQSRAAPAGSTTTLSVLAAGSGPLTYQWLHNGRLLRGANAATLTLTNLEPELAGSYAVRVNNGPRTAESAAASVEIGPAPAVLSQDKFQDLFVAGIAPPINVTLGGFGAQCFGNDEGNTQSQEPNHGNAPGGASRWFRFRIATNAVLQLDTLGSGINTTLGVYAGTNLAALTLVTRDDNGAADSAGAFVRVAASPALEYAVAVDGFDGARGHICLNWRVGLPPTIVAASVNPVVRAGGTVTLNAGVASALPPPVYQWWFGASPVAGATNASLTLSNFQAAQAGTYSVVISNFAGVVTNQVALVSLAPLIRLNQALVSAAGRPAMRLAGPLTNQLVIEATANLTNWTALQTLEYVVPLDFTDTNLALFRRRFYRGLITPPAGLRPAWATNNGRRVFQLTNSVNQSLLIEASTNLTSWTPLLTNSFTVPIHFTDSDSTNFPARFYRLRQ